MLKKTHHCLTKLACGVALCAFATISQAKADITLRIAHTLDNTHPVHKAMDFLGERLKHHSNNTMDVEIYASGQLGSERELIELLQIGSLSMTKVSASSMEAFVPAMRVFSLPYLFNNQDHLWTTLNSEVGKGLLNEGIPFRVKGLGYYDAGSRSFYSKTKPITQPSDLKGMKIRVLSSPMAVEMVDTMGGSPTPISWGELYTSLQQGVVDGAENNPPSFYLSKHYEVCKYYLLDEHTSIPDILIIGTHTWNKLSPQQQEWLQLAMDESVVHQRALWAKSTQEALDAVKAAGVQVMKADKSLFQDSVASMIEKYKQSELGPVIEQIIAKGK